MSENKLKDLASRAFMLWRVVHLFREVGLRGILDEKAYVRQQTTRILDLLDPATRVISEINQPGYRDTVLADATEAAGAAAQSAIDKTALVLGHSILDEVATECCRISVSLTPDEWTPFLHQRKVTLAEVLQSPSAAIADRMLSEYVEQLSREPLSHRLSILNQKYQPAPPFQHTGNHYTFDGDRLTALDGQRQGVVHGLAFLGSNSPSTADDLRYLEATCFFLIFLLSSRHAITVNPTMDTLDALVSVAASPLKLAYEGLLLATSLPVPDEQVWSFGGRIYVRSAAGHVRQLPLVMPAASPDISPDRTKAVFVKERMRPADEPYTGHIYGRAETPVVDIWMSAPDGAQPHLLLRGGPHPELAPPNPAFGKELEGITSPRFNSEARRVYFIADAWATSGAVYSLDLASSRVTYFTDGNAFAVLHGEPYQDHLVVLKHRYVSPPDRGSYDHFWLVYPDGRVGDDVGETLDGALERLYGPQGRKMAFPHL